MMKDKFGKEHRFEYKWEVYEQVVDAEIEAGAIFGQIEAIALYNQRKVLQAFADNNVGERHLKGSTGYGYGDIGRDMLCKLYADIFGCESALVSPLITGGTHALAIGLFALLRPGDTLLSVTGKPYDTLDSIINGDGAGSMKEYDIRYQQVDLIGDEFDYDGIRQAMLQYHPKVVFITRSRGYSSRNALSVQAIGECISFVKEIDASVLVFVDNCYGEFVDYEEPTEVGADLMAGSLIKNVGGGLAPTGGYLAGTKACVEQASYRLTAPGIGNEVGSYAYGYQYYYQGLFMAPHVVGGAVKSSVLFSQVFSKAGYKTIPAPGNKPNDIICSIVFDTEAELIAFIRAIQKVSPIDSNVVPYPWDMPGYQDQVIMAAGTFVGGASIELSADAPIKKPYIAYLQGALTYEHAEIACEACLNAVKEAKNG